MYQIAKDIAASLSFEEVEALKTFFQPAKAMADHDFAPLQRLRLIEEANHISTMMLTALGRQVAGFVFDVNTDQTRHEQMKRSA